MRLLLVLVVVLMGVWLWRSNRDARRETLRQNHRTAPEPLEMVSCGLCSVHISAVDAVAGKKGLYCCLEHCQRAEV